MRDPEVVGDAALRRELVEAACRSIGISDHRDVVRHAQQQRSRLGIGVTRTEQCLDLERRTARLGDVHAAAVVDDPFEDGERPDAHASVLHREVCDSAGAAAFPDPAGW